MPKITLVKNAMLSIQRFSWEQGVCMQACFEIGDIKTAVAMARGALLRREADGRLGVVGGNIAVTDPVSNGEGVWRAYEITGDPDYQKAAKALYRYLMEQAPRTAEGVLCHNQVPTHPGFSADLVWADSIYMAPPFLSAMGETEEAVRQILGMMAYLRDEETGVLRHIYDAGQKRFARDKRWATGNGWALMGLARVIDHAREQGREDLAAALIAPAEDLLRHLLIYQRPDGRFHDILDEEDSFVDGAAAMMTAAMIYRGIKNGWLSEEYRPAADKTADTMEQYVDEYGYIHGVCGCPGFFTEGVSAESMAAYLMMHAWKGDAFAG